MGRIFYRIPPVKQQKCAAGRLGQLPGLTDSKTLDCQRTNPREYQTVRTHINKMTWVQTWHHPTGSSTLCRMPYLNTKQNKNTNQIISRQEYHLTQPCPSEEKTKTKNKNSAQFSPYMKLTQTTGPTLGGQKSKGRKNSTLKSGKRRPHTQ